MTKAPAADQIRLLDVQTLDTQIQQHLHRRGSTPEAKTLEQLKADLADAAEQAGISRTVVVDLRREQTRLEDDSEKVRNRQVRDQQRLDEGHGGAKELRALQSELEALAKRRNELDDALLVVMEQLEQAQAAVDQAQAHHNQLAEQRNAQAEKLERIYAEIDQQVAAWQTERDQIAQTLNDCLVALYERLRASRGGMGAAELVARSCQGCRLELNPADLAAIRAAEPDEVVRCEECSRILVRGESAGL
ncbi:MAG: C4-type zinc ribbon domain-containing protein [Bifidobacteriaceae bacterium]|jgi:predicted  nucleic acid-binding Zn-ribbon protein|nr:C4-type zinc ribbon domain-containing protein [Bifidobacteriaceae bacterium]